MEQNLEFNKRAFQPCGLPLEPSGIHVRNRLFETTFHKVPVEGRNDPLPRPEGVPVALRDHLQWRGEQLSRNQGVCALLFDVCGTVVWIAY
jgi:hypothetical protein